DFRLRGQRAGGRELGAAGLAFDHFEHGVDRAGDVEVAADLGRARAADIGAAFVGSVFDEVGDLQLAEFFLAGGDAGRPGFATAFALCLLQRRFDEAEGGRVDFVLGSFVVDVGDVGQQHDPAFEV